MEKLDGKTMDIVQDNIEKLKQLFPEVFTEEKIDFEKLQLILGEHIETEKERYQFTWNGKTEAIQMAQKQSTGTLRPCKEESVDWDSTQNLYIEGDNLEVLRLLQNPYRNKVKMIYIDPPYNTGKDFVYKDNFYDNVKNYKESMDESYKSNSETSGRYHTDWLNFMYPRLKISKNLLEESGIIFVSIDSHEQIHLQQMMNHIFGEENKIANFIWRRRQKSDNRNQNMASIDHEYILAYGKTSLAKLKGIDIDKSKYQNPDSDPRGKWASIDLTGLANRHERPNLHYNLIDPKTGISYPPHSGRGWSKSKETMRKLIENGEVLFPENGKGRPRQKKFLKDIKNDKTGFSTVLSDVGFTTDGTRELRELFEDKIFPFPKPTKLIKELVSQTCNENDMILDFFAGSSSTAHAVMDLNAEDTGNRKFMMIQLPEKTLEGSIGYSTIAEIGKERIRRSGQKIKKENQDKEGIDDLDIGFKVFKLDETNLKIWDEEADDIEDNLLFFEGAVKDGRSKEDVLYEILLKYGLDLTVPIEEEKIGNVTAFSVGMGYLIVCLDKNLSINDIEQLVSNYTDCERMVFLDNGFATDEVKINAEQILKRNGIKDVRVI